MSIRGIFSVCAFAMDKIIDVVSGEVVLAFRPNGGTAVLLRSLWVTLLLYALAIAAKSYCADGATLAFSRDQLRHEVGETLPWLGAIFAGAYAAFYSRFAAQWGYLAGLYNQIMAACATLPSAQLTNNTVLLMWKAALIEDAQDLHLRGNRCSSR